MNSLRAVWGLRIGLSAATAALILVGASLNASGRVGWAAALAGLAGLIALAAGVVYRTWRVSVPAGAGALVLTLLIAQFNPRQGDLLLQLAGLMVLGAGGATARIAYQRFTDTIERQSRELEQKSRAFLAATSEVDAAPPEDLAALTSNIARQVGADFACCYLATADQHEFVPQTPGVGVEGLHPLAVTRRANGAGPLLAAVESGTTFSSVGNGALKELFNHLPADVRIVDVVAVPLPIGDRVAGFSLLGSPRAKFSEDDRRLATTLTIRAGSQLASAHAVALSQKESARYSVMNELVKEASGKTMQEALEVVLERGKEVIRYDAGQAVLFQPDEPVDEPLLRVRNGETVLRNAVTEDQRTFSGLLEQKTLETAVRVTVGSAGLLTRSTPDGRQAVIMSVGLPGEVDGMEFQNGQGIVGAVMLSLRATAVADFHAESELQSPPDLQTFGIQAAICTPMLEDGRLWGTLSVFDTKPREWTADDQRVLATLGNQGVVPVRKADLYEKNERSIWELRNLQEALQAATSTLDLNQVLQQVLAGAARASSAQIGCLALEDDGGLVLKGGFGTDHQTAEKLALGLGGEICRRVMDTRDSVMEAMEHESKADSPLNPRAVLCVPITLRGKPLGVVFLANYQVGHAFPADHRNLVTELATQAAVAIDNARLFKDREEVILASLEALASAVDARDPYTAGHSERVTKYALKIARQIHYSPQDPGADRKTVR